MKVLAVMEERGGGWHPASLEALAAAQRLAAVTDGRASAAVLGADPGERAADFARYELERVCAIGHPVLDPYTADAFTAALEQAIGDLRPDYVLFPHTYRTRDFGPKLAARLGRPFVSDVTAFRTEDNGVVFTRPVFQGKFVADVRIAGDAPHFVSVQAGAFRADAVAAGSCAVEEIGVEIPAEAVRTRPGEPFREEAGAVDLTAAERIVAAGRGVKDESDLEMIRKLAEALGAEVAASRPVCDAGWLPLSRQVGSSGQTVAPKLYVAVGISGAIQHLVGMKGSRVIVAINKDPGAPIFEVADYGIVGDLYEVVPALIEALKTG